MPILKSVVRPSDFNNHGLIGSNLRNSEKETLAGNIITISKMNDDNWLEFTFEDYKRFCAPRTNFRGEEAVLNALVKDDGILDKVGEKYSVNENFFRVLAKFIK